MSLSNIFAIISLLYVIFVVIFECPYYFKHFNKDHPDVNINWVDIGEGFRTLEIFPGVATFFYAYACHSAAIPVYKTLKNNIMRRTQKVFRRSIFLDMVTYVLCAICGFLTVPVNTPAIIIYRNRIGSSTDFAMVIARLGMALSLILSIPCQYNGMRMSLFELFFKTSDITNMR